LASGASNELPLDNGSQLIASQPISGGGGGKSDDSIETTSATTAACSTTSSSSPSSSSSSSLSYSASLDSGGEDGGLSLDSKRQLSVTQPISGSSSLSSSSSSASKATSASIIQHQSTLVGSFDVDDALSTWILARFAYIWVVFGYLAVPVLASLQGVSPPSALPPSELGAALVCAECGKLLATIAMLQAELPSPAESSAPWFRYQYGKQPSAWLSAQVVQGVGYGLVASVSARLTDALANGGGGSGGDGGGILALLNASGDGPFSQFPAFALIASSVVIAPALEELFFRGFLLPAAARRLPLPAAVVATSALFAAMHFSVSDAPGLFAASCAFGAAAATGGGALVAPTVAHATYNAVRAGSRV